MALGLARLPGKPFAGPVLCLSGSADRLIANRTSRALARLYGARHAVFGGRGHWLIAASAEQEVAGTVLSWLKNMLSAE
jgi:pimeloyl-ACP methyl ester carboxylesterase